MCGSVLGARTKCHWHGGSQREPPRNVNRPPPRPPFRPTSRPRRARMPAARLWRQAVGASRAGPAHVAGPSGLVGRRRGGDLGPPVAVHAICVHGITFTTFRPSVFKGVDCGPVASRSAIGAAPARAEEAPFLSRRPASARRRAVATAPHAASLVHTVKASSVILARPL